MDFKRKQELQIAYDAVSREYARRNFDELGKKPIDRKLLDLFAERVKTFKQVCEIGCGPGEVSRYLKDLGVDIFGIDISPKMMEEAARLNPDIQFKIGDVFDLQFEDESLAGIVAFYLIVNFDRNEIPLALKEIFRVLMPGGVFLISFHLGTETVHLEELYGKKVKLDFMFFHQDEIVNMLKDTGFEVDEVIIRYPYRDVEYQSKRAYVFAHRPGK